MGCQMLSLLLAVQHGVDRSRLGLATSLNQFARSIGAAIGVAAMGAIMSRSIAGVTVPGGGQPVAGDDMALSPELQAQFAMALASRVPRRRHRVGRGARARSSCRTSTSSPCRAMAGEQLIEAEMANLDAKTSRSSSSRRCL